MGPIRLDEWGPPMEEVVYILLSRDKDKFSLIYVDHCTKSDDVGFFTKNSKFKCWVNHAGTEKNLYLAIHPMFKSTEQSRQFTVDKIISKYKPSCNVEDPIHSNDVGKNETLNPQNINQKSEVTDSSIKCACCGNTMQLDRELEKSNLYKCNNCGISDTRLK